MKINWILQKNLTNPKILKQLKEAIKSDNELWEEVEIVPFSTKLPTIENNNTFKIIYGSTTFMLNAYDDENFKIGVFYNPFKFQMAHYVKVWETDILNYDGQLIKFGELHQIESKPTQKWFIRPNLDEKQFSGKLSTYQELLEWRERISKLNLPNLNKNTEVWISKPKTILKEWRLFVVDNVIVSASRYLKNGQLDKSNDDVPPLMIQFAQEKINDYRIADIYVIDIAEIKEGYKIIECNCFNGTGFYDNNIKKIVLSINQFVRKNK